MPNDKKPWEEYAESKREMEANEAKAKPRSSNSDPMERGKAIMRGLFGSRKPEETNLGTGTLARTVDAIKERNKKIREAY